MTTWRRCGIVPDVAWVMAAHAAMRRARSHIGHAATSAPIPTHCSRTSRREEQAARRGKLKIFFGASAGVGKTYAMLRGGAARARPKASTSWSARRDRTAAPRPRRCSRASRSCRRDGCQLPRRTLREFDLDAALARQPALILVDELAHTNAPGSRHAKRWQDVEELLAAGIDVYTTLNVQHLESLNDVVAQITGIRVRETVPDSVFDAADEVELVDLPPDDLLQRLQARARSTCPSRPSARVAATSSARAT